MISRLKILLRGDVEQLADQLTAAEAPSIAACIAIITAGAAVYGFTIGIWRAPLQAVYTAVKFPLLIFLTCAGNGVVNGMLAQTLGSGLSFRQTTFAILMSFAIAAVVLGGFAPITLFIWYNAPPLESSNALIGHSVMLLSHVCLIAFAGVAANRRLLALLIRTTDHRTGYTVFLSWLAGNLFVGAQLAWNLRPFIGSPRLAVQFLRPDPMRGNFYEAVWHAFRNLFL
jgi:hypothetical protein